MNKYLIEFQKYNEKLAKGDYLSAWQMREQLVHEYSWAVPSDEAIALISKFGPIIEIGAGKGYWASLLIELGVEVQAFDFKPVSENRYTDKSGNFTNVKLGSFEALDDYPNHSLFLCWPSYATSFAFNALSKFKGDTFIYVGESAGGCTGDDDFFEYLENNFDLIECFKIPQYQSVNDRLFIYKKKLK